MWQTRSTAIVPLVLALAGFGCGSDETRPEAPSATAPGAAQPTEKAAPEAAAEPVVPAPPGEVMEWSGSLPSDFPPGTTVGRRSMSAPV